MNLAASLDAVLARHGEIEAQMSAGAAGDPGEFARLSKEYADMEPVVAGIRALKAAQAEMADLAELIADPETDAEMRELAETEFLDLKSGIPDMELRLQRLLLPKDEADAKNAILEIRAGTGGDEAALFAADLYRMYQRYAEKHGWSMEALQASDTGIGGIKEVQAAVAGSRCNNSNQSWRANIRRTVPCKSCRDRPICKVEMSLPANSISRGSRTA